jgi:hypothetical protein
MSALLTYLSLPRPCWGITPCASWDRSYVPTAATFTACEHRATASHAERAHAGADGELGAPRRMAAAPPAGVGLLLNRLLGVLST